ncbi:MAG: aerotolerance regulator BatA [Epsilonproteobacteria bacterium]|nr:MAG: aerotolerance regulator BatA [Campylobacterota bacterium]RLA64257.1 MAG: aerotolerance regulator BatA [Campylobacterota bacterium]
MEFKNIYFAIWGILGLIFWAIGYLYLFKTPQVYIPKKYIKKATSLIPIFIFVIGIIGWLLISFSLTGPRRPLGFVKSNIEVNDIMFVVDVSRSMLADDFKPNRLEAAKRKIAEFVSLRPTDRIGIIIFSEKAFTLLPLSTDLDLIQRIIDEIKIGFLGSGTNIGDALGLGVGRLAQSMAKNKVIILLTDGVSNVGVMTPTQAAEQAADEGIKIYTIGVGGNKNARIPVSGGFGYQYIPGGSIDMKTLRSISKLTKGKSYQAGNETALKEVLTEIESLEKTKIETSGKMIYEEIYFKYLFWGVLLLLMAELTRKFGQKEGV